MKKTFLTRLIGVLIVLAGCSALQGGVEKPSTCLENAEWRIVEVGGNEVTVYPAGRHPIHAWCPPTAGSSVTAVATAFSGGTGWTAKVFSFPPRGRQRCPARGTPVSWSGPSSMPSGRRGVSGFPGARSSFSAGQGFSRVSGRSAHPVRTWPSGFERRQRPFSSVTGSLRGAGRRCR